MHLLKAAMVAALLAGGVGAVGGLWGVLTTSGAASAAGPLVGGTYSCATPLGTKKITATIQDLNTAPATLPQGTVYLAHPQVVITIPSSLIKIAHEATSSLVALTVSKATLDVTATGFQGLTTIAANNTPLSVPINTTTLAHGASVVVKYSSTPFTVTATPGDIATLIPGDITLDVLVPLTCVPPSETITYTTPTTFDGRFKVSGSDTISPIDTLTAGSFESTAWKISKSYPTGTAPGIQQLSCASTEDCFAVGKTTFFATIDGGHTWTTSRLPPSVGVLWGVSCPSSSECIAVGQGTATTTAEGPVAATTDNAGATWAVSKLSWNESAGLNSISCGSTTDCVAVGSGSGGGVEYSTTDGGEMWTTPSTPPLGSPSLSSVSCASASDCIAVGQRGSGPAVTKTTDGGLAWIDQTVSAPESVGLNSISCASATDCVAVGSGSGGGVVVATADGGSAWAAPTTPLPVDLYLDAVSCAKETTTCVATGSGDDIYETTSPQASWTLHLASPSAEDLYSVDCPSTDVCFAGGTNTVGAALILLRSLTPPPTITALTPASGTTAGGTSVTITGTNLTGTLQVRFGGETAISYSVQSATTVKAMTGAHEAGMVNVSVGTTHGTVTMANAFTYVSPDPTITSLTPTSGTSAGGTAVTITGTHLTGAAQVKFGGMTAASFSVENPTTIRAVTNAHGAGRVSVAVHTADGTATLGTAFSFVAPVAPARSAGYDMVGRDGGVFVFSSAGTTGGFYGSLPGLAVKVNDIVGMVPTSTDGGYFLVGSDGGVFAFGNAAFLGSLPGDHVTPSEPITGIVAANTDRGYFLVGRDGGVFAFGTVPFLGSLPGRGVSVDNIIGIASTPTGNGYWLVSSTGTVYGFGAAQALGTAKGTSSPVSAIAGTPTGGGYWITTQNGAVRAFGNAANFGTLPTLGVTPAQPVIGIVHTANTGGYWLIGSDGGIFAFGDAGFVGSLPEDTVRVTDVVGAVPTTT